MSYCIKASTPEAMRDEIVKWLNQQASNHRIASCKMASVRKKEIELARATTYQGAADFLKNCTVEVPTEITLCAGDGQPITECKSVDCKKHNRCCWQ